MKNKLIVSLLILFNIVTPAFAVKIPGEIKLGVTIFAKISVLVLISIILIWIGLNIYKKILNNKGNMLPIKTKKNKTTNNFKCEIDNVETIDEAINTFLTIDNRH